MDEARCRGSAFDFVPSAETPRDLESARALCNLCPVRTECLAYALLYHLSGYWGGTDTAERRRLAVPRNRVRCPECRGKAVIPTEEGHEICQHCGVSWAGVRPRLPEEAAG
jgi:WhiB family transcriptional regulator, redox-sensing transcriptional regulator